MKIVTRAALLGLLFVPVNAHAMTEAELHENAATIINLNGFLCAKVVEIRPLQIQNQYEVTCIEYRGGSGSVRYILDAARGVAFKAG